MTLAELKRLLDATGYPVAYSHFKGAVAVPFITYQVTYSANMMADNSVLKQIQNADIELYTNKKDLQAESVVESLLTKNEIPFDTTETYIESEQLFQKIYEVRLF